MTNTDTQFQTAGAASLFLAIVQGVMLAALFFKLPPHPPTTIPLFAMAPFLGVSIALALCATRLTQQGNRAGLGVAGLAALCALISFGPQKYVDPAFAQIWIAVIGCQLAVVAIAIAGFKTLKRAKP